VKTNEGSLNGNAKLWPEQVRLMRRLYETRGARIRGEPLITMRELAARYGISITHVANILHRRAWAWLD
jgi:hypothetical protein